MSNEENNKTQHEFIHREYVECAINYFKNGFGRQAMILLMLSGMKGSIIRDLKIDNLLDACTPYFGHKPTLEELLEKDPIKEEIIPVWTFDKNRLLCSTSQSLYYILKHLQKRIDKNALKGDNDAYLFIGENYNMNQLSENHAFDFVSDFKKELNKDKSENEVDFTTLNLVYTFQRIYEEHLPKDIKEDENYKKEILIKIFKGEYLSKTEKNYYDSILEDKSILINIYKKYLLEHLTIDLPDNGISDEEYSIDETSYPNNKLVENDSANNDYINSLEDIKSYTGVIEHYYASDEDLLYKLKKYYMKHYNEKPFNYDKHDYIIKKVENRIQSQAQYGYMSIEKNFKMAEISWLFEIYPEEIKLKYWTGTKIDSEEITRKYCIINETDTEDEIKNNNINEIDSKKDEIKCIEDDDELIEEILNILNYVGVFSIIGFIDYNYFKQKFKEILFILPKISHELEYEKYAIITKYEILETLDIII